MNDERQYLSTREAAEYLGLSPRTLDGYRVSGVDAALAASDTTFAGPLGTVTDMVSGTGGQLAAALAVGAALVGSVLRFNAMQLLGAVGVGVGVGGELVTWIGREEARRERRRYRLLFLAFSRGTPR